MVNQDVAVSKVENLLLCSAFVQTMNNLKSSEVLYMGDDIPDLKCLRASGLPCCPHDACSEVKETCNYISRFTGGYGCVRDVMEQIMKAQGFWMKDDNAFGW